MKYISIVIFFLALITMSCPDDGSGGSSNTKRSFWAADLSGKNEEFYRLEASLLVRNSGCEVWAEIGCGVDETTAQRIANEYSNNIFPKIMEAFGWVDKEKVNVMQYADLMGDKNGKLIILLLDIKDGYTEGGGYVAGYFNPLNMYKNAPHSNECDMIYLDTKPSVVGTPDFYETIAHEMQHLMNFVTSTCFYQDDNLRHGYMDTWIDEGLSSAAEWVYSGHQNKGRINWFNADETGLLSRGDNFYAWDNHKNETKAILNDYATVYLFFQWLRIQYGDEGIYREILISKYSNQQAVVDVMGYESWDSLLQTWLTANYNPAGKFGYGDDPDLSKIRPHYAPDKISEINLFPGEGVYSLNAPDEIPVIDNHGNNINYAYITGNANAVFHTLLTYNRSTNIKGSVEKGFVTGIVPVKPAANISSRSVIPPISGPYKIGVGDLQRQKSNDQNEPFLSFPDAVSGQSRVNIEMFLPFTGNDIIR
ncbi:MAG: hypothetical protein FWC06_02500 [Treponema sp.]|nr:hypothetical protein [Treponema sp.]